MAVARPMPPEPATQPAPPSLWGSVRKGASDLYYNSWRVVPVNLVLGVGLVGVAMLWAQVGALVAAVGDDELEHPVPRWRSSR